MGKITFVIGGARSGKSAYALKIASGFSGKIAFVATCRPQDEEMRKKIALHKKVRPGHWKTFEEPLDPSLLLKKIGSKFDCVIIDCLTLLVSNLMLENFKESVIQNKIKKMLDALNGIKAQAIIVSNEVGFGIVPENKLARHFRDVAGRANQLVAKESEEVFFLVSGLPWRMK